MEQNFGPGPCPRHLNRSSSPCDYGRTSWKKRPHFTWTLLLICVQGMPWWWSGATGHLPAGSKNLVLSYRTWTIHSQLTLELWSRQGANCVHSGREDRNTSWEDMSPSLGMGSRTSNGCWRHAGHRDGSEEPLVGCPHPLESSGREAPISGEEMNLLEFGVENVGYLVI